jgi:hypothetical protein
MAAESAVEMNGMVAPRSRHRRRARKQFDGRLVIGRRVKELTAVFRQRLGADADDPITAAAVRRAAETVALSEHLRARMLRGENVSPDDVLRTTRAADALTRRLHLDRHKQPPPQVNLAQYLAANGDGEVR